MKKTRNEANYLCKIKHEKEADSEDIFLWSNGTNCYRYESEEMNHMSDDYIVLYYNSEGYNNYIKELE